MSKLFNKNFLLLWQGQFVSRMGTQVFLIAMLAWIKDTTDSGIMLGTISAIAGAVAIVLGPFCGVFADRNSRKKIIVVTDILNGILMLALGAAFFFMPHRMPMLIVALFFTSTLSAVVSSFFGPAISAAIPDIVPKNKLPGANSMGMISMNISAIIGRPLGSQLYALFGAPVLFLINGVTFLFSAFSEAFITIPQKLPSKVKESEEVVANFKQDLVEGIKFIWSNVGLRNLVIVSAALSFFATAVILLLPFYLEDTLLLGQSWIEWYGYLTSIFAVGSIVGYSIAGLLRFEKEKRAILLVTLLLLDAVLYGALAFVRDIYIVGGLAFLSGAFGGFVIVNIMTILQATTQSRLRGRVFGALATIEGAAAPIAMALSGYLADLMDKNIPPIYLACSISMVLITSSMLFFKAFRQFLVFDSRELKDKDDIQPDIRPPIGEQAIFPVD
ncbi:MFS transporter [candidate division KSB1 bacterium]|nr:MFS transporter [candidate division KSB1 bacterium]RQW04807.1 MAG: MFS transporter [candidate division KSB1 bacterium]